MPQTQQKLAETEPRTGADPVMADPDHYTVEAEDERVRILRARYGPRAKSVMHWHPNSVAIMLNGGQCRFTYPDGRTEEHEMRAGTAMILPVGDHLPENLSSDPFEVIVVELKS